jgi:hypothetical protein
MPEYNIQTIAASLNRQGERAKASLKFSPVSRKISARSIDCMTRKIDNLFSSCIFAFNTTVSNDTKVILLQNHFLLLSVSTVLPVI